MGNWNDAKSDMSGVMGGGTPFSSFSRNDSSMDSFKCPNCSGVMEYSSVAEALLCKSCGGVFNPTTLIPAGFLNERDSGEAGGEEVNKREFVCNNCGATVVTDETTISTFCAFCGSPTISMRRLTREFRPDYIIPFKIDRKQAEDIFNKWVKTNKYVPKDYKNGGALKKLTGLYVPFWLIDGDLSGNLTGAGIVSTGTDQEMVFAIEREYSFSLKQVPFDGSKKIRDMLMEAVEPFDFSELVPFNPGFIPGFFAQRYDKTALDMIDRIHTRFDYYGRDAIKMGGYGQNHYSSVEVSTNNCYTDRIAQSYALLPVWFLKYEYEGQMYGFAVNGQTGEAAGDLPYSKKARLMAIIKTAVPFILIATAVIAVAFLLMYSFTGVTTSRAESRIIGFIMELAVVILSAVVGVMRNKVNEAAFKATNPLDAKPGVEEYIDMSKHMEIRGGESDKLVGTRANKTEGSDDESRFFGKIYDVVKRLLGG